MADTSLADYVGAVGGVVGMATGIFGAVMGYIGYRRSNQIKALDMRVALRKDLAEAREVFSRLPELMTHADRSRRATLAARGLGGSGAWLAWERMLEADRAELGQIGVTIRSENADFSVLSPEQLEAELIATHKFKAIFSTLQQRYQGEIEQDDEARRQIAQQSTTMAAARMGQNSPRNG
ncbi:MAG: hypothetical protein V4801_22115 [Burkholderia gladioli]